MVGLNVVLAHLLGAREEISRTEALLALIPLAVIVLLITLPRLGAIGRGIALLAGGTVTLGLAALLQERVAVLYLLEHLAVHVALAGFFLASLGPGRTPACTRFAAQVHETLSPTLRGYTRLITWIWGIFFLANGAFSVGLMLSLGSEAWVTYAVYATFPLVVAMFALEYLLRLFVLPREDLSSPVSAITAYRRHMRDLASRRGGS